MLRSNEDVIRGLLLTFYFTRDHDHHSLIEPTTLSVVAITHEAIFIGAYTRLSTEKAEKVSV